MVEGFSCTTPLSSSFSCLAFFHAPRSPRLPLLIATASTATPASLFFLVRIFVCFFLFSFLFIVGFVFSTYFFFLFCPFFLIFFNILNSSSSHHLHLYSFDVGLSLAGPCTRRCLLPSASTNYFSLLPLRLDFLPSPTSTSGPKGK